MGAPAKRIVLTEEEANTLKMLAAAGTTEQRIAIRAKVVLAAAQSLTLSEIAERTRPEQTMQMLPLRFTGQIRLNRMNLN